jgi:hypothetical protein
MRLLARQPRTETDSVSETSYSFKYRTMDEVQKPRSAERYATSSESCRPILYMSAGLRSMK